MNIDLSTTPYFKGDFKTYNEALQESERIYRGGYNSETILERVSGATQKVRRGEAAFERDGVAFTEESFNTDLLSALFYVLAHEGSLNLLDFGGSLGSAYFQNRRLFSSLKVKWNVVEQPLFVDYGRKRVPEVEFYYKARDLAGKGVNCVLMSSVLPYVDEPYRYLEDILSLDAKYIILDRMMFNFEYRDRIVLEYVPETIYKAVYPAWLLNYQKVMERIGTKYSAVYNWTEYLDRLPLIEGNAGRLISYGGWLFVLG